MAVAVAIPGSAAGGASTSCDVLEQSQSGSPSCRQCAARLMLVQQARAATLHTVRCVLLPTTGRTSTWRSAPGWSLVKAPHAAAHKVPSLRRMLVERFDQAASQQATQSAPTSRANYGQLPEPQLPQNHTQANHTKTLSLTLPAYIYSSTHHAQRSHATGCREHSSAAMHCLATCQAHHATICTATDTRSRWFLGQMTAAAAPAAEKHMQLAPPLVQLRTILTFPLPFSTLIASVSAAAAAVAALPLWR